MNGVQESGEDATPVARSRHDLLDTTFNITLTLKGLGGLLELVGAILLIVVSPHTINHLAHRSPSTSCPKTPTTSSSTICSA